MKTTLITTCIFLFNLSLFSQFVTTHPEIPRIDVHTHGGKDHEGIANYLELREHMLSNNKLDIAMLINLNDETVIDSITTASNGRIMSCLNDYKPFEGLTHSPEDIVSSLNLGYAGYKIWHGSYTRHFKVDDEVIKYFDDLAHEPVLTAMEEIGFPLASTHIADPNGPFWDRGKWAEDPVEFWRQILGLERVLARHPNLNVVVAHCAWLICQDAQIDFLRYLLSTYPNLNVDLAATFQYFHLVDHNNLRDFIIEYSDRILYGTDISTIQNKADIPNYAERYSRTFRFLETEEIVEGGFFGMNPVKGVNLPKEVLEKIYYKNALRIYPGLAKKMDSLGYSVSYDI